MASARARVRRAIMGSGTKKGPITGPPRVEDGRGRSRYNGMAGSDACGAGQTSADPTARMTAKGRGHRRAWRSGLRAATAEPGPAVAAGSGRAVLTPVICTPVVFFAGTGALYRLTDRTVRTSPRRGTGHRDGPLARSDNTPPRGPQGLPAGGTAASRGEEITLTLYRFTFAA